MSRFGDDPHAFFDAVYRETAPWDIGEAQPALMQLLAELPPRGPVLDVGCGSGDLAVALARLGYETIGIDFVASAIELARSRAAGLPEDVQKRVRFEVGDALHPSQWGEAPGAVVDSGFLHLFERDARERFVAELASVLPHGARYYLLAFAVTFPIEHGPLAIDANEVATLFSAERGWRLVTCGPAEFVSRIAPVPATLACAERAGR